MEGTREADIPTQNTSAQEDAWISQPDAHSRRADGVEAAQEQGPPPAHGVTAAAAAAGLTSEQVKATFREGQRGAGAHAAVAVRPNGLASRRISVTVGRRFGNAVRRNRLRRRLREALRELEGELPGGIDVVCTPRGGAPQARFADLVTSVRTALAETGTLARA